jgi:hypothetical protein
MNLRVSICTGLVLVGAALAACSGGGSGSHTALPTAAGSAAPATNGNGNGLKGPLAKITFTIPRHVSFKGQHTTSVRSRHGTAAATRRTPKYVSGATEGLQIGVAGTGTSQIVYVDASNSSSLCTSVPDSQNGGDVQTCTVSVPVVAASETITVDDVDVKPSNEGTDGNPPGYGNGFSGGHVLAVGTTTATLTAGQATAISFQLGMVVGGIFDCGYWDSTADASYDDDRDDATAPTLPSGYSAENSQYLGRVVFSAGQAGWIQLVPVPSDWDDYGNGFASPSPAFVDVNGSPQPMTLTSNVQHVGLAVNNATAANDDTLPTPPPYASTTTTASISDQSYFWWQNFMPVINVVYDGSPAAVAGTISFTNNLTATDLFGNPPYTWEIPYTVAFVSASPTTLSLSLSGTSTGTVTGTDYKSVDYDMAPSQNCLDSNGDQLATITTDDMNTTTWQQPFIVTATAMGTCTFALVDGYTGVPSQTITVTIGA